MIDLKTAMVNLCEQVSDLSQIVESLESRVDPAGPGSLRAAGVAEAARALLLQLNSGLEIDGGEL